MGWGTGTQIGQYEILGTLGYGGMGEVYKVRHLISHRVEAMKVLLSDSPHKADLSDRFLREIRVLATLCHPNIATLHTAFREKDQLMMVMEFVEGTNLADRFVAGIPIRKSIAYTLQVLSALEYAHLCGVVHRDIKPSNIMITPAEQVKLLDFGLALSAPDARLTAAGSILGSIYYMSPEQVQGEEMDPRSDLYSLAVTLYELLTGELPIKGHNPAEIIAGHLQKTPRAPIEVNPAISPSVSNVVVRALEKNRSERFQTAAEFTSALLAAEARQNLDVAVVAARALEQTLPATLPSPRPEASPAGAPRMDTPSPSTPHKYEPAVLNEITKQLANYIGPIAPVIVKRASSSSMNLHELCEHVANEIESADARQRFMLAVRKHYLPPA